MEDGKYKKKINYGEQIMSCPFFQMLLKNLSFIESIESAKLPEKYAFADSMVSMKLKIC